MVKPAIRVFPPVSRACREVVLSVFPPLSLVCREMPVLLLIHLHVYGEVDFAQAGRPTIPGHS